MAKRMNRWALDALVERSKSDQRPSDAAFAREARIVPSTLVDLRNGRRDASEEVLIRLAQTLEVDPRAISADPFGLIEALEAVAAASRNLLPHLNGGDFGLRKALAHLDQVEASA